MPLLDKTRHIPDQDVILEQLAHRGAYGGLDSATLATWGYREAVVVADNESGFRAVLYLPLEKAADPEIQAVHGGSPPPVLAFRGTTEKRALQDGMNRRGIGSYQFASNEGKVLEMLNGRRVIATGHSLGGALAQLAAANFPTNIMRVVTFQSPGIAQEEADKVKEFNRLGVDTIKSTHHRAAGDLVHSMGDEFTEGDIYTYGSTSTGVLASHSSFPLARLEAARGNKMKGVYEKSPGADDDKLLDVARSSTTSKTDGMLEAGRRAVGRALGDASMERYIAIWDQVQRQIAAPDFSLLKIYEFIATAPDLTAEQRDKMRSQAIAIVQTLTPIV